MSIDLDTLLAEAQEAARESYSPYSKFRVGAAVLMDGRCFRGANIENASYGLTCCAERSAIFAAASQGCRRLEAITVTCPDAPDNSPVGSLMPCGACRQVMAEFGDASTLVVVDRVRTFRLDELLPNAFVLAA